MRMKDTHKSDKTNGTNGKITANNVLCLSKIITNVSLKITIEVT